ncbi:claspin [Calliphora vicina]|uniref:claspin n=1 Tax=Calliphora vicina TaxID=7373 RepID=UPI00325B381B
MEVEHLNTSGANTSMEELKVEEDENVKETSMEEDILGTQSLLMSESDEDDRDNSINKNKKSPLKKKNISKRSKRILDSDDEDGIENKQPETEENEEVNLATNKKKISTLIDSDSEVDEEYKDEDQEQTAKASSIVDSDEDITKVNFKQIKQELYKSSKQKSNKIKKDPNFREEDNTDTEKSDSPKTSKESKKKSKKLKKNSSDSENTRTESKKISSLVDSESSGAESNFREEDNTDTEKSNSPKSSKESKKKFKKLKKNSSDSENTRKESKKISSLVDSESSGAESQPEINDDDFDAWVNGSNIGEKNNNEETSKGKEKKPKVIRASAKKALDEMQAIQSEQQRLHREAHISIPYHKPKKHTLDEFLKRRTIIQPQTSSPVSAAVQTRRLKMTPEELEEYAKLMEEREKEATEFFKSESESEEEEVFKDNEGVLDKTTEINQQNQDNTPMDSLDLANDTEIKQNTDDALNIIAEEFKENLDGVQLTEEELAELLAEQEQVEEQEIQERPTCSKVLITEVIELPKLDMNTVRLSPIKKHTPRPSLNIKQLLAGKNLSGSPSLSGDPNKLIDLETGDLIEKKPTGIENLMKRLMATVKNKKSKTSEACNIVSLENGKLEISKVNISVTETKDIQKEPKPGAAYFELKKNLKEIIKKKRMDEINKKQEDELEYSKCLADDDDDDEEEEDNEDEVEMEVEEYEPEDKPKNKVVMVDDEENALVVEDDENEDEEEENVVEINSDEDDSENKDEDEEEEEDDDDDDEDNNDDDNHTEPVEKSQRKNRIIKAFDDSDEEVEGDNDDIDFLKTQPRATQPPLFDTQASAKTSQQDEETELLALCSGTFDDTQKKTSVNALMSQIPLTQNGGKPVNDEELMELCSGTFDQPADTQQPTQSHIIADNLKAKCNKIVSSDEENEEDDQLDKNEQNKQRVKKLTKKLKKKKAKLGFSDDEDEEEEEEDIDDQEQELNDVDLEEEAEEPETFVDYDSEENEVIVQMTKKDKVKQAQNFVEKEAELSESEWGSADEDEKNLDTYDIELGDEDEFDREKLRTELGQIHARKMLDEDLREVRKIQEMLFEDEEKDGVGRQRTFKWKNAESGFSLDDGRPLENDDGQNGDSGDELNEHQWRKIRHEREQFLKEQGLKPDSQDMSTVLPNTTIPSLNSTTTSLVTTKKLHIITAKKTSVSTPDSKKASPFLISKGISSMHKKSVRGSFLVRDKDTLNKLAGLTKGTSSSIAASDMDDTAGTVSIKSIKAKNFVFATLTEEEHENLKRKSDDLLNSSNENGKNFMKKPRIEPRRDKCFIDQLL